MLGMLGWDVLTISIFRHIELWLRKVGKQKVLLMNL